MRQHDHWHLAIRPTQFQGMLVSLGAHDIAVDPSQELRDVFLGQDNPIRVAIRGMHPIYGIVFIGDEAIEAGYHVEGEYGRGDGHTHISLLQDTININWL